ncbi:ABC transporter substrate-binding protein [Chloroflexota bacterium]
MKRLTVLLATIMVLVLLLSCAPKEAPTPTPTPKPTPTPPAVEKPKYGGIWRQVYDRPPAGYDMHLRPPASAFVVLRMFNNLVSFDPKESQLLPENIIGDLAERWEISPNGMTYTFYLVKNAKWHDGMPFTADDVVYNINKFVDKERSRIYGYYPAFQSVEKIDDYTVKIHLKYPSASFLGMLASPYAIIEPKHLAGTDPKSTDFLVGTGPFMYKSYTEPIEFEMVKNPDYFKTGLPYLDGIKMYFQTESATKVSMFTAKRVDSTTNTVGLTTEEEVVQALKGAPDAITHYISFHYGLVWFVNQAYEPLRDVRVRRALSLVIDPQELIIAMFGGTKWGWTERVLFPPAWELPKDEAWKTMGWDKPFEDRVSEAKTLMAEAGYDEGFPLRILVRNSPWYIRAANYVDDLFRRHLNLDVELMIRDTAELGAMRNAREFDLFYWSLLAFIGDLDELAGYFVTEGSGNYGDYSNAKLDQLFDEQSRTMDPSKRKALAHEIERIILTDLPILPTGHCQTYVPVNHPYLKGFVPAASGYAQAHLRNEYVWLDK